MIDLPYDGRCVVAGDCRLDLPGKGRLPLYGFRPAHIGELLQAAVELAAADLVMLHRDALSAYGLPAKAPKKAPRFLAPADGWEVERGKDGWWLWLVKPSSGGRARWVVVPAWDDRPTEPSLASVWGQLDYDVLVRALARFAYTTRVAWLGSAGRTAESLIESTHPRARGGNQLKGAPAVPEPADDGTLEQPYTWRRPLGPGERAHGRWVHHFDLNAAYCAAWQTVELPAGEPALVTDADPGEAEVRAGLWRVDLAGLTEWWAGWAVAHDAGAFPPPWHGRSGGWLTSPTLARCVELGWSGPVGEAWIWPGRNRHLRAAAERLRDARTELSSDRSPSSVAALAAVKALWRVQTGRFNMASRDERSRWHLPHWGHFVRAQARANLHRRLVGSPTRAGWRAGVALPPFAITTDDMLIVATDRHPDPAFYARVLGLPYGPGLGQFKSKAVVELTAGLLAAIDAAPNANQVMAAARMAAAA